MKQQPQALLIYSTLPGEEAARSIGETLVKERLAACVNIIPGMRSIYEWKGKLEHDAEVVLIAKTMPERADALAARLAELHPYEVPAILRLPVMEVNTAYLDWLRRQTVAQEVGDG